MQKIKFHITIALILVIIMPAVVLATNNPPSIPLTIYGDVKIDNNVAPINTVISVFNNNTEIARTIINQEGKYFVEVGAENKGQILTYKINGSQAIQAICADPLSTPSIRLDLAIFVVNSNITSNTANNSNTSTTNSSAYVANSSQNQNSSNSSVLNNFVSAKQQCVDVTAVPKVNLDLTFLSNNGNIFHNPKVLLTPKVVEEACRGEVASPCLVDKALSVEKVLPKVLSVKIYADGTLLRGKNKKVYVIKNGKKQHIKSLKELKKYYFGKKIYDINNDILNKY